MEITNDTVMLNIVNEIMEEYPARYKMEIRGRKRDLDQRQAERCMMQFKKIKSSTLAFLRGIRKFQSDVSIKAVEHSPILYL